MAIAWDSSGSGAGATTLQVKLTTRFGTCAQQEKSVTLRLAGRSEVATVGEFTVGQLGQSGVEFLHKDPPQP